MNICTHFELGCNGLIWGHLDSFVDASGSSWILFWVLLGSPDGLWISDPLLGVLGLPGWSLDLLLIVLALLASFSVDLGSRLVLQGQNEMEKLYCF